MDPQDLLIAGGVLSGVTCLGLCVFVAVPNFVEMQNRAKRAEAPANLGGIRTAQVAYESSFDTYVDCPTPQPRPVEALDDELVPWPQGGCFDTLGWAPDGHVRATYWVEVSADGSGFTAHAMLDLDEDGVPAHYVATATESAYAITSPDVY